MPSQSGHYSIQLMNALWRVSGFEWRKVAGVNQEIRPANDRLEVHLDAGRCDMRSEQTLSVERPSRGIGDALGWA